jgi:hypothetical protein
VHDPVPVVVIRALVLALATAGCNAVLGLDAVRLDDAGALDRDGRSEPDAGVDAACAGDRDCDGVVDAEDRCPDHPDLDQHDEDVDSVGDACDNCPGAFNPDQGDTTEAAPDGIGDACDPHPTTRERRVLFDPFSAGTIEAWDLTASGVAIAGDELRFTADTGAEVHAVRRSLPPTTGHTHVVARFAIDGYAGGMVGLQTRGLGVWLASGAAPPTGRRCEWTGVVTRLTQPRLAGFAADGTLLTPEVATAPLVAGQAGTLQGHQVAGNQGGRDDLTCWLSGDGWADKYEAAATGTGAPSTGVVALTAYRTMARIAWLEVYEHP